VERYIVEHYDIPAKFVEQKTLDAPRARSTGAPVRGLPGAHHLVDTVFEADLSLINRVDADGIIWARSGGHQRFGVIVTTRGLHDPHRREAEHAGLTAREHRLQYIRD